MLRSEPRNGTLERRGLILHEICWHEVASFGSPPATSPGSEKERVAARWSARTLKPAWRIRRAVKARQAGRRLGSGKRVDIDCHLRRSEHRVWRRCFDLRCMDPEHALPQEGM